MRKAPGSRCHRNQKRNKGLYWGNRVRRPMPHWHTLADFLDETDLVQELQKYHHAAERSDRSVGFGHGNHLSIDDSGCLNLGACLLLGVLACHCSKDTLRTNSSTSEFRLKKIGKTRKMWRGRWHVYVKQTD